MSTIDNNSNPNFYQFDELNGATCNVLTELGADIPNPKNEQLVFLKHY
jgi:hypothetical protein